MRTKTILLTAALVAAGVASSMAQSSNVYSLNVVGYVNIIAPPGFSIVNTPLDTGNNVDTNLWNTNTGNIHNGCLIYTYVPGTGFVSDGYINGWGAAGTLLNPGTGYMFYNSSPTIPITNTFVGTVLQGTNIQTISAGFNLVGFFAPISGTGDTNGIPQRNGEIVYTFTNSTTGFQSYGYLAGAWSPSPPPLIPAEGFFLYTPTATNWAQTNVVQ